MEIHVEKVKRVKVTGVEHVGPYYAIEEAWGRLFAYLAETNQSAENQRCFSVYLDDVNEVPATELRSLATVSSNGIKAGEGFQSRYLAGGNYAVFVYTGNYLGLGDAWAIFHQSIAADESLERRDGACFEEYLNDPMTTSPDALETKLYVPVKVRKRSKVSATA